MNEGFFIARKQADGRPGVPIGNEDGAVMVFEKLTERVFELRSQLSRDVGHDLAVFRLNISVVSEVVSPWQN